jgi:hypothetical protein
MDACGPLWTHSCFCPTTNGSMFPTIPFDLRRSAPRNNKFSICFRLYDPSNYPHIRSIFVALSRSGCLLGPSGSCCKLHLRLKNREKQALGMFPSYHPTALCRDVVVYDEGRLHRVLADHSFRLKSSWVSTVRPRIPALTVLGHC